MSEKRFAQPHFEQKSCPEGTRTDRGIAALEQIIRRDIETRGPITFARFMELALYQPQHGYYASGRACIGRRGDFFTNVSVGPIFGKLLAWQFLEVWNKLGRPTEFTIVEQGAHDGQLAADVLNALRESESFSALRYIIIEPFPVWRERQQATLREFAIPGVPSQAQRSDDGPPKTTARDSSTALGMTACCGGALPREKIGWVNSIEQLQPFTGVHFSNELFDALPVQLFKSEGGVPQELCVTIADDEFVFNPSAGNVITRPSFAALKLMSDIVAKLERGIVLTIDFGYTREQLAHPGQSTVRVRAQHRELASPFEQIGCADISAAVDWTSLVEAAQSAGAMLIGLTDQHHLLTGILAKLESRTTEFSFEDKRGLQMLLHPEMLGRSFQVLGLAKNFDAQLSGFSFARAPA